FSAVDQHLTEAVAQGVFPGAVVLVNRAGTVLYRRASGWRSLEPDRRPLSEETVFDLASLTKPLATTLALMLLVRVKKLRPYCRAILGLEAGGKKVGFVGTRSAKEFVYTQLQREKLEAPPGQRAVYSDLGFMLLGAAVEAVSGLELDRYCWGKIFHPLGLR